MGGLITAVLFAVIVGGGLAVVLGGLLTARGQRVGQSDQLAIRINAGQRDLGIDE